MRIFDFRFAICDLQLQTVNTDYGGKRVMHERELKRRTKRFSLRVIRLVAALPKTIIGRIIGHQLARSGTSTGANYRAACRARSRAEFRAKLGTVEEEADESAFWMELIIEAGLMDRKDVESLLREAEEIAAIMAASRITMSERDEPHTPKEGRQLPNSTSKAPNRKLQIENRK